MRYLQEFPEIVLELHKYKNELIDKLFDKFISIHLDISSKKMKTKYESFYGHSLFAPYDYSSVKLITFDKFKQNLNKKLRSVNSYFGNNSNN